MGKLRKLSLIEPEFAKGLEENSQDTVVYQTEKMKGSEPWITVYSQHDSETDPKDGYFWTRRGGKDSVAFLLYDKEKERYGAVKCYHGPSHTWQVRAFTGSLDKDKSKEDILKDEVREEAGYTVDSDSVKELPSYYLGHNTDEKVTLYVVDITGLEREIPDFENDFEKNSEIYWLSDTGLIRKSPDWKVVTILLWADGEAEIED